MCSDVGYVRATLLVRDGSIQFPSQVVEKIQRYLLQQWSMSHCTYYDSLARGRHTGHTPGARPDACCWIHNTERFAVLDLRNRTAEETVTSPQQQDFTFFLRSIVQFGWNPLKTEINPHYITIQTAPHREHSLDQLVRPTGEYHDRKLQHFSKTSKLKAQIYCAGKMHSL